MIIDLVSWDEHILRYETDTCPDVGHTISCLDLSKTFKVLTVNHLIKERTSKNGYVFSLVTLKVEEVKN